MLLGADAVRVNALRTILVGLAFGLGSISAKAAGPFAFRIYEPGLRGPQITSALAAYPATYSAESVPAQVATTLTVALQNVGDHPFDFYASYSTGTVAYFTSPSDPDADGQLSWDTTESTCQPGGTLVKGQSCTLSIRVYFWNSTPSRTTYNRQLTIKGMDRVTYGQVTLTVPITVSKR